MIKSKKYTALVLCRTEKIILYVILGLTLACSITSMILTSLIVADGVKLKTAMLDALKIENLRAYAQDLIPGELIGYIFQQSLYDPTFLSAFANELSLYLNTTN